MTLVTVFFKFILMYVRTLQPPSSALRLCNYGAKTRRGSKITPNVTWVKGQSDHKSVFVVRFL